MGTKLTIENTNRLVPFVIDDLTFLSRHSGIKSLKIIMCQVNSLDGIQDLVNLKTLKITQFNAPNLNGIEYCTNLRKLHLCPVADINSTVSIDLSHLNSISLEVLDLSGMKFHLGKLIIPSLQKLCVSETVLSQMPGKISMPNLKEISFYVDDDNDSDAANYIDTFEDEWYDQYRLAKYPPIAWLLNHVVKKRYSIKVEFGCIVFIRWLQ
jgi:hypothetical protein